MQIFHVLVPLNLLYDFLDKVCMFETNSLGCHQGRRIIGEEVCFPPSHTEEHYFFDTNSFKRMIYLNLYKPFLDSLKEYMKPMKYIHYTTKPLNYMLAVSILKEICKQQNLSMTKYNGYYIEYRECRGGG